MNAFIKVRPLLQSFINLLAGIISKGLSTKFIMEVIVLSQTSYYKQTSQALINLSINCCGNIIANPGPKECSQICHWDLNRIAAYNFTKVSFLQVLSTTYFIFLYEIFLNQISFTMIISIFKDIISFAQTILTIKREWVCILKNKSLL